MQGSFLNRFLFVVLLQNFFILQINASYKEYDRRSFAPQGFSYTDDLRKKVEYKQNDFNLDNFKTLQSLVNAFVPVVYLHPRERFFPCSVNYYLRYSDLYQGNPKGHAKKILAWNGDPARLGSYRERGEYFLKPRLTGDHLKQFYYGFSANPKKGYVDAPYYVNVVFNKDQSEVILQVWFFYAFNGPTIEGTLLAPRQGSIRGIGTHQADWEHVDIYLKRISDFPQKDVASDYKIDRIFYAAHGETRYGKYKNENEIEFVRLRDRLHPVVYSSLNSHASKYSPRLKDTQLDTAAKSNDPRWTWLPDNVVIVSVNGRTVPGQQWIQYGGIWGGDGNIINNPSIQGYWLHQYEQKTPLLEGAELPIDPKSGKSPFFNLKGKVLTRVEKLCFLMEGTQGSVPYSVNGVFTFGRNKTLFGPLYSGKTMCESRIIPGKESQRGNQKFKDQQTNRLYISVPDIYKAKAANAKVKVWAQD